MELKEKQKLYILFGIFGIAAFIVYYSLLLKPQFSRIITNNREFYTISRRVKNAEVLIANENGIRKQYANLKKEAELLETRFPSQDDISSLLEGFSSIAESSGVKILRIRPLEVLDNVSQRDARSEPYSEFPILIEARSGYHQGGVFINKLENMDRFIKIDDVDIRGRSESPRHHDIKLRVITYIMQ